MAKTGQWCWNGKSTTIAVIMVGLVALGLIIGTFRYQRTANATEHTTMYKELSDLGQRTTAVETLQPVIMAELRALGGKIDTLVARKCPATER